MSRTDVAQTLLSVPGLATTAVVAEELPRSASRAAALVRELLRRHRYDRTFALRLLAIARDGGSSHELRCLASLALEHQFRFAADDQALALSRVIGIEERVERVDVIRARIARNESIHNRLRNGAEGLRAFLLHTRRECRLYLARFAF